jgi:hypothetical protein
MAKDVIGAMLPWQWQEDAPTSKHGDGISRPRPKTRTKEFRLIVYPQGAQPMTWITRAESKKHAIRYAEARWPGATVEVA